MMNSKGYTQCSDSVQSMEEEEKEEEDADADAHLCIRCHITIIGLDNYVAHRKTSCHSVLPSENIDDKKVNDGNKDCKEKKAIVLSKEVILPKKSKDLKDSYNQILNSQSILPPIFQDPSHSVSPNLSIENNSRIIHDIKELQSGRNIPNYFSSKKSSAIHSLNEKEMCTDLAEPHFKNPAINSSVSETNVSSLYGDDNDPSVDSSISQDQNLDSPSPLDTPNVTLQQHLTHHIYEASSSITKVSGTNDNMQNEINVEENLKTKKDFRNKKSSGSLYPSYENKVKHVLDCQNPKQSAAQTPFTNFTDPLLHTQDNTNIFRQFEGFVDQGKTCRVGSPITPIFSKSSTNSYEVENPKTSYDLESHNFDSRYQDFYSIQSSSQESLLSSNHLINISAKRNISQEMKTDHLQVIGCMSDPHVKSHEEVEVIEYQPSGEYSASEAQLSAEHKPAPTADMVKDEVLRQDDFLSSLELRSRPKIISKPPANEEEEEEEYDEDEMCPPRHHTGGKWRPGLPSPSSISVDWRSCTPHNQEVDEALEEVHVEEVEDRLLPPSYTKGKWLPGKRMTNKGSSNTEHFCQPCNRKLRDKNTYDRHLLTQFHFINEGKSKAKLEGKRGSNDKTSTLRSRPVRLKSIAAKKFIKNTIAQLKSKKICAQNELTDINDSEMLDGNMETQIVESNNIISKESLKKEFKEGSSDDEMEPTISSAQKLMCPICRLSFGASYVSLHFASLAHIHNELEHRNDPKQSIKEQYNGLILKYIDAIVKTSYFKCNVCKFYCNLHEDLYIHMKTHNDETSESELRNIYTCSSCLDENAMQIKDFLRHLETPHHKQNVREEVLLAHQVTVDSKTAVTCSLCNKHFRYLHAYRKHRRIFHDEPDFQLSHQRLLRCPECDFKAPDYKLIRSHLRENHEDQENNLTYYCFVCGLGFKSLQEAETHRRSVFHRTTVGRQKGISVARTCNMCYEDVPDLSSLRSHMIEKHSSECSPCHVCGYVPPLRADLAQHQRNCKGEVLTVDGKYKCQLCPFKNNLLAHVLSHTTLSHGTSDSDTRYPCHICKTKLRATSVKGHMLSHSNEWPHGCHLCSRKFPAQEWLNKHLATVHHRGNAQTNTTQTHTLCHLCGATFTNRSHLARHLQQHHGHSLLASQKETPSNKLSHNNNLKNCTESNTKILCHLCGHEAESPSYMKIHMRSHRCNNGGQLDCPHCNYVTSHLPHLRRHLRLHTGARPFVCPYCSYECNNQENLRKHMLKTKLHPGRYMYECRLCIDSPEFKSSGENTTESQLKIKNEEADVYVYKSNYSKELHSHLLQHHQAHFTNKEQVTAHIRSYYHPETDITVTDNPKPYFHKKRKRSWGLVQKDCVEDVTMEDVTEDEAVANEQIPQSDHKQQTIVLQNLPLQNSKIFSSEMVNIQTVDASNTLRLQTVDSSNTPRHQMDNSDILLKQVKQILKEEQISKGDQSSCRQVIMIVPDEIVSSVGELASLLPSLGLQTSSDNISVLTLHSDEIPKTQQQIQGKTAEEIQEKLLPLANAESYTEKPLIESPNETKGLGLPSKTKLPNQVEINYLQEEQNYNRRYEVNNMLQIPNSKLNVVDTKIVGQTTNRALINVDSQRKETIKQTKGILDMTDNKSDNNILSEIKASSEDTATHVLGNNTVFDKMNICKELAISPLCTNNPQQLIQGGMFVSKRKDENITQNSQLETSNEYKVKNISDIDKSNFSETLNGAVSEHEMQSIVLVENTVFDDEETLVIHENLDFPQENTDIMQKGTHFIREVATQDKSYQGCNMIFENKNSEAGTINNSSSVDSQQRDEYDKCLRQVRHDQPDEQSNEYDESLQSVGLNEERSSVISVDEVSQSVEVVTSENYDGSQVIYTFTL